MLPHVHFGFCQAFSLRPSVDTGTCSIRKMSADLLSLQSPLKVGRRTLTLHPSAAVSELWSTLVLSSLKNSGSANQVHWSLHGKSASDEVVVVALPACWHQSGPFIPPKRGLWRGREKKKIHGQSVLLKISKGARVTRAVIVSAFIKAGYVEMRKQNL